MQNTIKQETDLLKEFESLFVDMIFVQGRYEIQLSNKLSSTTIIKFPI